MISVRLYSTLRKYCGNGDAGLPVQVEFESGMTVAMLAARLGIGEIEVMLVAVNKEIAGPNHLLRDGDNLSLFGAIAGGEWIHIYPKGKSHRTLKRCKNDTIGSEAGTRLVSL